MRLLLSYNIDLLPSSWLYFEKIFKIISKINSNYLTEFDDSYIINSLKEIDNFTLKRLTQDELSKYLSEHSRDYSYIISRSDVNAVIPCFHEIIKFKNIDIKDFEYFSYLITGKYESVRDFEHYSMPDKNGKRQQFLSVKLVRDSLNHICEVINLPVDPDQTVARAIFIMTSLLNTHAFKDGNGRLARAMFNAYLLKAGLLTHGYIPLAPFIYATEGNFELAERRASIQLDFEPMCKVMYEIIKFYYENIDRFAVKNNNDSSSN